MLVKAAVAILCLIIPTVGGFPGEGPQVTPVEKMPGWKVVSPEIPEALTTWEKIVGLAQAGDTTEAIRLFDREIAPKLGSRKDRLERLRFLWGSAKDTTRCLECISEIHKIVKAERRRQKDAFGYDMSNYDFQLDADVGNLYYEHGYYRRAASALDATIRKQIEMMERLPSSRQLTADQRRKFLAREYVTLAGCYQSVALVQQKLKQYEAALETCRKMLQCGQAFDPPLDAEYAPEVVERVRRSITEGARVIEGRIKQEMAPGTAAKGLGQVPERKATVPMKAR